MSGKATSFTQAVPIDLVPAQRRAIADEDLDVIAAYPLTRPHLYGGSRNNHMESCIQQILEAFPHAGIAYLCKHHVVLEGEELSNAIQDLRRFLRFIHAQSDVCVEHFKQHIFAGTVQGIRDEIDRLPQGVEEAIADFEHTDHDRDNYESLLRFVNAHAAVLEDARSHGMGAMYCVWLYGS